MSKVINLTHNRFASCSTDKTAKIWSSNSPYQEIASLTHDGSVYDVLKLKQKEIVVKGNGSSECLDFWNSSTYQKISSIKGVNSHYQNGGLIELQNNYSQFHHQHRDIQL